MTVKNIKKVIYWLKDTWSLPERSREITAWLFSTWISPDRWGQLLKIIPKELEKIYEPIHAGGGIVFNEDGDLLMIYRRGKWDLPKGKRDEDETIEECAIREVSEETGLKKLSLGEKVCNTYHIYSQNKKNLLKHTVWYKMKGTKKEKPEPQAEENILEVRWVSKKDVAVMLSKSYEGIKEVLGLAGVKLK